MVVDCAELQIQKSKCLNCCVHTYSVYKGGHTIKFMVGIAPDGTIIFVSRIYGGRASDKFIFNDSKIIDLCEDSDAVMADKGFAIKEECKNACIILHIPPYADPL